jgi:parallel beta-helix repeat protein
MKLAPVAASLLAIPALAAAAGAGTLKVPSDEHATIQSAVAAAVEGDTILVGPGVYPEAVTIESRTGIRLKGKGFPTIQPGPATGILVTGSTGIEISGFEIYQASTGVLVSGSTDVTLAKMVVSGSIGNAFQLSDNAGVLVAKCEVIGAGSNGVQDSASEDLVVEKCSFQGVSGVALYLSPYNLFGSGSDRAKVSKNTITECGTGMQLGGADVVVEKNRVQATAGYGIYFDSSSSPANAVVTKNVVSTAGSDGIRVPGINFEISGNRLTGGGIYDSGNATTLDRNSVTGGNYAIYAAGSGTKITRNTSRGSVGTAIQVNAYYVAIERNKVYDPNGSGIHVNSTGERPIAGNQVSGAGDSGFIVSSSGNTLTGNKATACDEFGFYVAGTGNTFSKNRASANDIFDLADINAPGANTYAEDNRFGTQQIPLSE